VTVAVLVTRPQPGAADTARRLAFLGREAVVAPVLELRPISANLPPAGEIQAVLVTSANALRALSGHTARPLFAVGDATAAKARAAGFLRVESAGGDSEALAALVSGRCDPSGLPLLLAGQEGQGGRLAGALRGLGFAVVHHSVYAMRPVAVFPPTARQALMRGEIEAALFFSPASARHFVALAASLSPDYFTPVASLAMSPDVATALGPLPWKCIRIAAAPNQDVLLTLLP
jgi:uroporphyrinogen-III synthase